MPERTTAVQYGVGPIGSRIVDVAVDRGIEFVGAIDVAPEKVGRELSDVVELDAEIGVEITDDPSEALAADPDLVFHATGSSLSSVAPQLREALAAGADVVSTTEELSYPWWNHGDIAEEIDRTARSHGVTCLGTGINPGFAMDTLPVVLSTACRSVDRVRVERVQDAAVRRGPLQEKIGVGTSIEEFREHVAPEAGHVGLLESTAMIGDAFGWELDAIDEEIEPVVAETSVTTDHVTVDSGDVAGIHQIGRGYVGDDPAVELNLSMYVGASDPHDAVSFDGVPDVSVRVEGGFHGDVTTPAIVLNVARRVREADPGLATMIDLQTPSYAERP